MCPSNYSGATCESKLTCDTYCLNGGSCRQTKEQKMSCVCPRGFSGTRCEMVQACSYYCFNRAPCTPPPSNSLGDPTCHCPKGLRGPKCDDIDETTVNCTQLECHHGWCQQTMSSSQPACFCEAGWHGLVCNKPSCHRYCLNGGTCRLERDDTICM